MIEKADSTMSSAHKAADEMQLVMADARKSAQAATDVFHEATEGKGALATLSRNRELADDLRALIHNLRVHGVLFYHDSGSKSTKKPPNKANRSAGARAANEMTPLLTVNLLRILFVTFCGAIGAILRRKFRTTLAGDCIGIVFGLIIVLIDRLLQGFSLRAFSSATFGLLLGLLFANLLIASDILHYQSDTVQWLVETHRLHRVWLFGMMLAMRSNRDEFSLIIPYVRFARETTQHEPLCSTPM